jgi:hypothetical protein
MDGKRKNATNIMVPAQKTPEMTCSRRTMINIESMFGLRGM